MPTEVSFEVKLEGKESTSRGAPGKESRVERIRASRLHGLFLGARTLTPRNASHALGGALGRRHHEPLGITKVFDSASFHFFNTKAGKGIFPEVRINMDTTKTQGQAGHYFTITLTNAVIARHGRTIILASQGSGQGRSRGIELEDIRFTFQKIECTWIKGGVTATDDWEAKT